MHRSKIIACLALVGLAISQQACLQSTMLPAHKLQHGEIVVGGAAELSAGPRLSANVTAGLGDVLDVSVFGAYGTAFFGVAQSYAIGGGVRGYLPFGWALSLQLERDGFLTPLGDTNQLVGLWQGQARFLSIPTRENPFYIGPVLTTFTLQNENLETGNLLGFVGGLAGVNFQVNEQVNVQTELLVRPFFFLMVDGADTQTFSLFNEGGQYAAQLLGLFQINFGGNFSFTRKQGTAPPSDNGNDADRRL